MANYFGAPLPKGYAVLIAQWQKRCRIVARNFILQAGMAFIITRMGM